jgi:hypothetical protein
MFLLSVAAAGLVAAGCGDQDAVPKVATSPPGWLAGAVGSPDAASRLGRLYLDAHPEENDLTALLDQIEAALGTSVSSDADDQASVLAVLNDTVQDEYIRNEVVSLQDWILSRTEARIYAAVALVTEA